MQISMGLAEALARFAYVQSHQAETSEADRQKAIRDLALLVREDDRLIPMMRAERVKRYGWHPAN